MNDTGINTRADWQGEGTLSQLSGELRARQASRIDCTVDPRQLLVNVANTGELLLASVPGTQASEFISTEGVIIRDKAVTQLCTRMNPDVPARFGKSLATMRPNIAVDMFNSLISQDDYSKSRRWFVRQLRGQVRAILSDRYLAIDDEDLMFTALQELQNHGGWVMSAQLTDDNMRMSYCCPSLGRLLDSPARGDGSFFDAGSMANPQWLNRMGINEKSWPDQFKMLKDANGNMVLPGGEIGNSETGNGSAYVRFKTYDSICFNGCTLETVHHMRHLGEKLEPGIWQADTITHNHQLRKKMIGDAVTATFDQDRVNTWINRRVAASHDVLSPTAAVDNVATLCTLSEDERDELLTVFCRDYVSTREGLSQAAARVAQDATNPDKASEWQSHAATIIVARSGVTNGALITA